MDSAELRQMSITNAKLALNQWNGVNNQPIKFLSPTQHQCLEKMMIFFKRNREKKFPLMHTQPGRYIEVFGWNIYEWLDGFRKGYFKQYSKMLVGCTKIGVS